MNLPLIVAHRGASGDAPENTLAAFELAWQQGADAIEGDFQLTADGRIVCIHDADTQRVAGTQRVVKRTPLSALLELDVGAYRGERFIGRRIPTLAEVLASVPAGKRIYIEIKCGPAIVLPLLGELEACERGDEQLVIISFDQAIIREIKSAAIPYKAYWLVDLKRDAAGLVSPSLQSVLRTVGQISADGVSASHGQVDEAFIAGIKASGQTYHAWTVDDVEVAQRLSDWGASSITTNWPGRIRAGLEGRCPGQA